MRAVLSARVKKEDLQKPERGEGAGEDSQDLRVIGDPFARQDVDGVYLAFIFGLLYCVVFFGLVVLYDLKPNNDSHEK